MLSKKNYFLVLFVFLSFFFIINSSYPAESTNFYTLASKWEKQTASGKTKKEAVDDGFRKAFSRDLGPALPVAPTLQKDLSEIVTSSQTEELELNQLLILKSGTGFIKSLATDEGIALLELQTDRSLRILATGIGSTFIHVWDGTGRSTFELRVKPPIIRPTSSQIERQASIDKTRSFKISYDNGRSAFYTGPKYQTMTRNSLDFTQNLKVTGDTPYGELMSNAQTQKNGRKLILTDAHAELKDGKIGNFRNFNAEIGDSRVTPNLLVFPAARIRGGVLEKWGKDKRWELDNFYGREQSSVLGTLTPGFGGERTRDSFLAGSTLTYKLSDAASVKGGYFSGYGKARSDELNKHGAGVQGAVKIGPALFVPEVDTDNEHIAQKHALTLSYEKFKVKGEYRNISENFFTLIGSPEHHGELGYLVDFSSAPTEKLSLRGSLDIFKDRLIPDPNNMGYYNFHKDFQATYLPWDSASLIFNYLDYDDTGRLGPTKQRTVGTQFNQRFKIWDHPATFFTRYQVRGNRVLNNSTSDYINNQITLGLQTQIFWGINFTVEQELNYLKEPTIRRLTHPRATIYTLDYNHQVGDLPLFMDATIRYRDEEETESQNSFMSGEDSVELSGGLTYREYENFEIFLTGSFESFREESLLADQSQRVEAQFYTGMRYIFDTHYHWSNVGTVQGSVFKDVNGDGTKQLEEPGLADILVRSSDGRETKTDAKGFYVIPSVSGKTVIVTMDSSKIPLGYVPTGSLSQEFEVEQGKTKEISFGLTPRSEITGIIFNDLNENGIYETNEVGVRKVKILLENGQSARTNSIGAYTFSGVLASEHTASLDLTTLPEGYLPLNVPKKTFTVFEGIRFQLNFPLRASRLLTGRVFADKNKNGYLDTDESGVPNVEVQLGAQKVLTDSEGWYLFDSVKAGTYELMIIKQSLPIGFKTDFKEKVTFSLEPITISNKNIPISFF